MAGPDSNGADRPAAAIGAPNSALILFSRVSTPPPTSPQTAICHFGHGLRDSGEVHLVAEAPHFGRLAPLLAMVGLVEEPPLLVQRVGVVDDHVGPSAPLIAARDRSPGMFGRAP